MIIQPRVEELPGSICNPWVPATLGKFEQKSLTYCFYSLILVLLYLVMTKFYVFGMQVLEPPPNFFTILHNSVKNKTKLT